MFLYIINASGTNKFKIGVSKDPKKRLLELQTGNGDTLSLVHTFSTKYNYRLESSLHNSFRGSQTIGEWFEFTLDELEKVKAHIVLLENSFEVLEESDNPFFKKGLKKS